MTDLTKLSDRELISKYLHGRYRNDTFNELYRRHDLYVRKYIAKFTGESDVEDIAQNTWMKVHQKLAGFQNNCAFRTWVVCIAVNFARLQFRNVGTYHKHFPFPLEQYTEQHEKHLGKTDEDYNPLLARADSWLENLPAIIDANRAYATLPESKKEMIRLARDGYTGLEMAKHFGGKNVATIKARLLRSRSALREAAQGVQ